MTWLVTAFSLLGIVLNIRKNRLCFVVWFTTNTAWCVIDLHHGVYAQAALMATYAALSVWGLWSWRTQKEVQHA